MRRLFSPSPRVGLAFGLPLMRIDAASALIVDAVNTVRGGLRFEAAVLQVKTLSVCGGPEKTRGGLQPTAVSANREALSG